MKSRHLLVGVSLAVLTVGGLLTSTHATSAHERRSVQAYSFVVGFLSEPVVVNQPNSVDLRISKSADASPVTGLEKTLKAEIAVSDKKMNMDLSPRFNTPGAYNAYFTPTATSAYTFRFSGTIEGAQIDEKFTSSPTTFGTPAEPVTFPNPLVSGQVLSETQSGLEQRIVALESKSDSGDDSSTALAVGIVGVIVGATGLAAGGLAMSRARKA